jgi:hypothetical protein
MLSRLSSYFKQNLIAFLALFVAMGGTGAYAANTIGSSDIIDGQVNSADVKDQSLTTFDVSTFLGADVVDHTLTTDDIAAFTLTESNVASNTLGGVVIKNESLTSDDIANGALNDQDIGETVAVDFVGTIGVVPANSCAKRNVILSSALGGDHMILTANSTDAAANLHYSAEYQPTNDNFMTIKACNPTTAAIDDGNTHFNLLAINAQ